MPTSLRRSVHSHVVDNIGACFSLTLAPVLKQCMKFEFAKSIAKRYERVMDADFLDSLKQHVAATTKDNMEVDPDNSVEDMVIDSAEDEEQSGLLPSAGGAGEKKVRCMLPQFTGGAAQPATTQPLSQVTASLALTCTMTPSNTKINAMPKLRDKNQNQP